MGQHDHQIWSHIRTWALPYNSAVIGSESIDSDAQAWYASHYDVLVTLGAQAWDEVHDTNANCKVLVYCNYNNDVIACDMPPIFKFEVRDGNTNS